MATATITIPSPVISAPPAHFEVRYRPVGSSTWTAFPDQSNVAFTITGLTEGDWELGITYVGLDEVPCEEVIYPFHVGPPCECLELGDIGVRRQVAGGPAYLVISYTPPATPAPCGYIVRYAQSGLPPALTNKATVYFNPLPLSPIKIPIQGLVDQDLEILSDCCEGNVTLCYEATIVADPEPAAGCEAVTTSNTTVAIVQSVSTGQYFLQITMPTSTPTLCPNMLVVATQIGMIALPGYGAKPKPGEFMTAALVPPDFYPYLALGRQNTRLLHPDMTVTYLGIRYNVAIHDCCGNVVYFPNVTFTGTQIP